MAGRLPLPGLTSSRYFLALIEAGDAGIRRLFANFVLFLEFAALRFAVLANIHHHLCHFGDMRRIVIGKLLNRGARGNHVIDTHGTYGHPLVFALAQNLKIMLKTCLACFHAVGGSINQALVFFDMHMLMIGGLFGFFCGKCRIPGGSKHQASGCHFKHFSSVHGCSPKKLVNVLENSYEHTTVITKSERYLFRV
ncbi:MAG: hypothetical protein PHG89_06100 [Gallionella sp.]|nr:hypothetical protein [Gallionella sp.]